MTTNWERVEAAFDEALRLTDTAARSAYLARLAGEDASLAAEVQALLSAETSAGRFLDGIGEQTQRLEVFTLQPGQRLGRYRIDDCLAAGGMGVVYRAEDEQLQRRVALKFLAPRADDDPEQRQRLLDEARWASRLDHPNVCTIHEIGETDTGQVFIVMALCPGEDLGRRLRRAPLSVEAIVKLALQLTEALMAAHGVGVLHRDLKPGNVIVDEAGAARLVDFGIAAAASGRGTEHTPAGTLAYMAPEQIAGGDLDERCDIWGIGALLFEALTGRRPFPGRDGVTLSTLRALDHAAPPPGSVVPGVPPALDAVVQRCLHPDPAGRFADAAELHAALRRLLQQTAPESLTATPAQVRDDARLVLAESGEAGTGRYVTVLAVGAGPGRSREAVLETVTRFGGREVSAPAADVVLALFGYPVADEYAALRAARCAEAVPGAGDANCVAVASGPGWFLDAEPAAPLRVGGEVFQRARALLERADAGPAALDAATRRLTEGRRFGGRTAAEDRGDVAGQAPALTPLIGRVHELGLLRDAWARCLEDEQQAILIGGEPGIGKSRLVQELTGGIAPADRALVVDCQASPHQMASPLHPVVGYLRGRLLDDNADAHGAARRLRVLLRRHGLADPAYAVAIARLLGLPEPAQQAPVLLSPELEKERGLDGLARLLLARARQQPCLLVLEDLHWADPTTLGLLERLWRAASAARLLVVCTHRPEFRPPWSAAPGVTHIRLARLRRSESRAMAEAVTAAAGMRTRGIDEVLERCDGIPLFIEELAADLMSGHGPGGGIPWTLQDSLLGRLEQLGDARQVAQAAAVAGRSVGAAVLERVVDLRPETLRGALETLQRAGLLLAEGGARPAFRFKHALIRDAAYASLPEGARRQLHRRVADVLADPAAGGHPSPEVLARHWEAAEAFDEAAGYWAQAAAQALGRFAIAEAQDNARRGLAALERLPHGTDRQQMELNLCMTLGPALMAAKGYADDEVSAVYTRARSLCAGLGDPPDVFPVLFGLWTFHCVRARHDEALTLAESLVRLAAQSGQDELLAEAHMVRGITRYFQGEFLEAETDFAEAWSACEGEDLAAHTLRYGQDPAMVIRSYQSWNAWQLGRSDDADAFSAEAVELARASRHPFSIAYGLTFAAWHAMNRMAPELARDLLDEAIALCREHRIQVFLALALALDALRRMGGGEAAEALEAMEESLKVYRATGAELFLPAWYGAMAQAAAGTGRPERAAALLDEAMGTCER
ncbi:protein kinase, partial [Ectothiorhodospiraceae bacterium WFHF3C12]|nr:protein kinase [Ectothiorhodospiraceae bacterium WFHF3C12]